MAHIQCCCVCSESCPIITKCAKSKGDRRPSVLLFSGPLLCLLSCFLLFLNFSLAELPQQHSQRIVIQPYAGTILARRLECREVIFHQCTHAHWQRREDKARKAPNTSATSGPCTLLITKRSEIKGKGRMGNLKSFTLEAGIGI